MNAMTLDDTEVTDKVLNLIVHMSDDAMFTTVNYVVGNLAYRLEKAGTNVTYLPILNDHSKDGAIAPLVDAAKHFTTHVQRQIEFLRTNNSKR